MSSIIFTFYFPVLGCRKALIKVSINYNVLIVIPILTVAWCFLLQDSILVTLLNLLSYSLGFALIFLRLKLSMVGVSPSVDYFGTLRQKKKPAPASGNKMRRKHAGLSTLNTFLKIIWAVLFAVLETGIF